AFVVRRHDEPNTVGDPPRVDPRPLQDQRFVRHEALYDAQVLLVATVQRLLRVQQERVAQVRVVLAVYVLRVRDGRVSLAEDATEVGEAERLARPRSAYEDGHGWHLDVRLAHDGREPLQEPLVSLRVVTG